MRHEVIIEIKKTTALTSASKAKDTSTSDVQRSEVMQGSDFDLEVERAQRSIELIDSNLMDGNRLRPEDFTDNVDESIKVSSY